MQDEQRSQTLHKAERLQKYNALYDVVEVGGRGRGWKRSCRTSINGRL